jgi:pSer/pThr/pTyr-binding forkhead associated (FHA) protein
VRLRFRVRTTPEQGSQSDRVVEVEPSGDEVRIGRRGGLEIQLPFTTISGLHARVVRHGAGWAVLDMGSVNGTFVGDDRLTVGVPRPIDAGDLVRLADVSMVYEGESGAPVINKEAETTATLARRLVADLFQAVAGAEIARVVVDSGPFAGKSLALALPDRPYKVGRAPECDLTLTDEDVSREHAAFERRWQGVYVRDLGSKNGLEIGGRRLRTDRRVHDGEVVIVGSTQLRVDDPEERYLRQMEEAKEPSRKATPAIPSGGPMPALAPASVTAGGQPPRTPPGDPLPSAISAVKPMPALTSSPPVTQKKVESAPFESAHDARAVADPVLTGAPGDDDSPREPGQRVWPLFVTVFALAVLGGVGYLVWVVLVGMGSGARP